MIKLISPINTLTNWGISSNKVFLILPMRVNLSAFGNKLQLAHQILLGENRILENYEYLTDLIAITSGFRVFIGNSRFQFSSHDLGWQSSAQGYLPKQIIAYSMAWLS